MWAVWSTSHVNTLSGRRLILVLRSFWVNYSAELLFGVNVQINMQEPGTSPFKCHWRNYVAINCMQDPLLIYPVVLIVLWRCANHIPDSKQQNADLFLYGVCVCFGYVRKIPESNEHDGLWIHILQTFYVFEKDSVYLSVHVKLSHLSHWFHCAWHFESRVSQDLRLPLHWGAALSTSNTDLQGNIMGSNDIIKQY